MWSVGHRPSHDTPVKQHAEVHLGECEVMDHDAFHPLVKSTPPLQRIRIMWLVVVACFNHVG